MAHHGMVSFVDGSTLTSGEGSSNMSFGHKDRQVKWDLIPKDTDVLDIMLIIFIFICRY